MGNNPEWKKLKNCKKRGEWAELVFASRAIARGLYLARPWGESCGYDFIVDEGRRLLRVQVKSAIFREGEGYSCSLKDSRGPYKENSFDYVAAYVIPEDLWYILPEPIVRGMWSIGLHPELEDSKYAQYLEAWHLLSGPPTPLRIPLIQACADEAYAEEDPPASWN
jgi:PD-(D/E)XK endonuclease